MTWTDHQRAGESPVTEVLKAASFELRDLHERYEQLTKRIRALRTAVDVLNELQHSPSRSASLGRVSFPDHASGSTNPAPSPIDPIDINSEHSEVTTRCGNFALRRACRIAMLETFDPVSTEEIYSRIVRRGSFCFPNAVTPNPALQIELAAMAEQGEVRAVFCRSGTLWQRIPNIAEQD